MAGVPPAEKAEYDLEEEKAGNDDHTNGRVVRIARGCEEDFGSWPRPAWGVPGLLIVSFLAIMLVFISPGRFHSIFLRSWLDFPSLLASLNPSKSTKIRSQEAIHLGLQCLIDF